MAQLRNLDQRLRVIEEERQGELTFLRNAIRQNQQRLNNLFGRCGEPDAAGCPEQQGGRRKKRKSRRKKRKTKRNKRKRKRNTKKKRRRKYF